MNNNLPLTEARKNLSELVNQAYYEGKPFGISKGKKAMGMFVGAKQWNDIINVLEKHDQGLADTLAIMADSKIQKIIAESESDIKNGHTIPLDDI